MYTWLDEMESIIAALIIKLLELSLPHGQENTSFKNLVVFDFMLSQELQAPN